MSTKRERLPNRRPSETISYDVRSGIPITATVGMFPDGRIGELFIRSGRVGTDMSVAMIEMAVAVSLAFQFGCTAETMRAAMPRTEDGKAEGAVGQLLDLLANRPKVVSP